jgi:tetratricopeptide (TPR) repeat protein
MIMQKTLKVIIIVPLISLIALIVIGYKTTFGWENSYKSEKQERRFQDSSLTQFKITLDNTFTDLEQKTDNLEAMNQNLQGRVSALSSEKDKLASAYAQLQAKQSALENEHNRLKRKTASLEVSYKRLEVAYNKLLTEKARLTKKTSDLKAAQRTRTGTGSTTQTVTAKRVPEIETKKSTVPPAIQPSSQKPQTSEAPIVTVSEEQRKEPTKQTDGTISELDITKINEKGIDYGKKGMYDKAIREFQKVAAIEPNMPNIHYNLGLAYKKQGMNVEADRAFAEYERLLRQAH